MATETALQTAQKTFSADHLECSICQERYKKPKILDCVHSFCEKCLEDYHTSRYKGASKIPCPLCRQEVLLPESGVSGLKANFHLIGMVEDFALQEKVACSSNAVLQCECCKEDKAMYRCVDCAQNICFVCQKTHLGFAVSSSHTVVTLEDIRQGKVEVKKQEQGESKCQRHRGEVNRFYCETCEELICQACSVVVHKAHSIVDAGMVHLRYKRSLEKMFPALNDDIKGLQQTLQEACEAKLELNNSSTQTVQKVYDRVARIIAEVKAEQRRLIDAVTTYKEDCTKRLEAHEETVRRMLQKKQHSLEIAKDVTKNASVTDFLSLYPIISRDMESLESQKPHMMVQKCLSLNCNEMLRVGDINLARLQLKEEEWEMCLEFGKEGSGPGEFNWTRGIAACQPDEIAVTDYHNKRVVVFNIDQGLLKTTIPLNNDPRAVAAILKQLVVVDTTAYVKIYKSDLTLEAEFPTVPQDQVGRTQVRLHSVAVKDDHTILVGDVHRKVLTEHSPSDHGLLLRTIPVEIAPYYLHVVGNGRLAVSDGAKKVVIVDYEGVTLVTIRPVIGGHPVDHCTGVCGDGSNLYVAMHNVDETGHIHRYDARGVFLGCVSRSLFKPQGISFAADRHQIAVADFFSVKMYHVA